LTSRTAHFLVPGISDLLGASLAANYSFTNTHSLVWYRAISNQSFWTDDVYSLGTAGIHHPQDGRLSTHPSYLQQGQHMAFEIQSHRLLLLTGLSDRASKQSEWFYSHSDRVFTSLLCLPPCAGRFSQSSFMRS